MSEVKLTAESRTEFGKGAARRLRREAKVPAVLYGHGTDPLHLALPGHATMMALKQSNALLTLDLGDGRTELALPKDVQRHATRNSITHVDLLLVKRGEKVTVEVPLHFEGEAVNGTIITHDLTTLSIEVEATHIPSSITVVIEGLGAGARITAGEVALPKGAELVGDPDALVVAVSESSKSEADDDDAAADGEAPAAE